MKINYWRIVSVDIEIEREIEREIEISKNRPGINPEEY